MKVSVKLAEPRKVLVWSLSYLFDPKQTFIKEQIDESGNIEQLMKAFDGANNSWEMPFKAILHHSKVLKEIFVVASLQSFDQYPLFESLVRKHFKDLSIVRYTTDEYPNGVDFNKTDHCFQVYNSVYDHLLSKGYKESDFIIDVTGGKVPTSIGGAILTLTRGRRFEYVDTENKDVNEYDLGYEAEPDGR